MHDGTVTLPAVRVTRFLSCIYNSLGGKTGGKVFYPKLKYIFLELANFVKTDTEIRTEMDQWFWLFRHLHKADQLPAFLKKRVFSRIFNIAEISNLSEAIS